MSVQTYVNEADCSRCPTKAFSQDSSISQRHGDANTYDWSVNCNCRGRLVIDNLPRLIEEAKIAQMTAGELKAESILIKTVPATLKPFGNTGLTGFRVETKLRFCVEFPLSEANTLFPSKAPYSLASSSESTRVTPNSSVWTT